MPQKPVSRRALLKTIFVGGAAVSSSAFLPKKWVKPVVESGVLPVHAQVSATGSINGTVRNTIVSNMDGGIAYTSAGRKPQRKAQAQSVAGQTINLYMGGTAAGTPYRTVMTDATGFYEFLDLPPGLYTVCWQEVEQCLPTIEVGAGQTKIQDFIYLVGSISGTLSVPDVQNSNGGITYVGTGAPLNGLNHISVSVENQTINLYIAGTLIAGGFKDARPKPMGPPPFKTTLTDAFGKYKFENLAPGIYDVEWENWHLPQFGKVVTSGNNTIVDFIYSRPIS
jgi:hypothetical protein